VNELFTNLLGAFAQHWADRLDLVYKVLSTAVYTPACGLALHRADDAEVIIHTLVEFRKACTAYLSKQSH
jgi:hypothetical protein